MLPEKEDLPSRDNKAWPILVIGSVIAYLISAGEPPTQWDYKEWLQALSAAVGIVGGIFGNSPLLGQKKG